MQRRWAMKDREGGARKGARKDMQRGRWKGGDDGHATQRSSGGNDGHNGRCSVRHRLRRLTVIVKLTIPDAARRPNER
jgi:hypothetical protein